MTTAIAITTAIAMAMAMAVAMAIPMGGHGMGALRQHGRIYDYVTPPPPLKKHAGKKQDPLFPVS